MKGSILVFIGFAMLSMGSTSYAYEIIDAQLVRVTAKYTEPTQNTDNTKIKNLQQVYLYYNIGKEDILVLKQPATQPQGGGTVEVKFPVPVADGEKMDVRFSSRAVNSEGLISEKSNSVILRIDRSRK
jgi:hypothetical protein